MIYFDHASTTPLCKEARQAMEEVFDMFGNPSSPHSVGREAAFRLRSLRGNAAELLGCAPSELIFVSGGTEANATAISGILPSSGKDTLLVGEAEHASVLRASEKAALHRKTVRMECDGTLSLHDLKQKLNARTRLVSVMHCNNESGILQPVEEIGRMCRENQTLFHTDAVQSGGKIPLSLRDLPVDLCSLSAHKFGGPKGIGLLYCKSGVELSPVLRGGMQENGRRAGTESLLLASGLVAALESSLRSFAAERARLNALTERLERGLTALGGVLNPSGNGRIPGFLSVRFPGMDGKALTEVLDLCGICISAGAACHANETVASHAWLACGLTEQQANETVRISLGVGNTSEEVEVFLNRIKEVKKKMV